MNDLKYCSLFNKYNNDYNFEITKACVYLHNEGLVLNSKGEVFHILNTRYKLLEIFNGKTVIDFSYAAKDDNPKSEFIILIITEYEVYGFGHNDYGQLFIQHQQSFQRHFKKQFDGFCWSKKEKSSSYIREPKKIAIPYYGLKFTSISCVFGHCMLLASDSCLTLWGRNDNGQIGNGKTSSREAPYRIEFRINSDVRTEWRDRRIIKTESKIKSIACSYTNSYVLLDNGDVYAWGNNSSGQLGTIHIDNYVAPYLIYSRIQQFLAVCNYALALRMDGALFGTGVNSFGQISDIINSEQFYDEPFKFALKFKKIATWKHLSMGITEDDRCFLWGKYGEVEFITIRLKIPIYKRKLDDRSYVYLIKEKSECYSAIKSKQKSKFKSNLIKEYEKSKINQNDSQTHSLEFPAKSSEDLLIELNNFTDNEFEDTLADIEDEIDTDENLAEKIAISEMLKNGQIEKQILNLNIKKPLEIRCKSFSKIIAKRFDETYFTVANNSELSNDYIDDDEDADDLIDMSKFIAVIYEYEETYENEVKPVAAIMNDKSDTQNIENKEKDEISDRIIMIEEKFVTMDQTRSTVQNFKIYNGDKTIYSVFNKSSFEKVNDFTVSDIHQTGNVGGSN